MKLLSLKTSFPQNIYTIFEKRGFVELRPSQYKAIKGGVFDKKSLLICTPTASGKTVVAEFALLNTILNKKQKALYIVPLKALASEKYKEFSARYKDICKVGMAVGDYDSDARHLASCDLVIVTSEKCDSLIRNKARWIEEVGCLVVDEIHLLNDVGRGPTLEIVITILRQMTKDLQIIGLSATIGNPQSLADWLKSTLIIDDWRPVELKQGIYHNGEVEYYE